MMRMGQRSQISARACQLTDTFNMPRLRNRAAAAFVVARVMDLSGQQSSSAMNLIIGLKGSAP